jgi:hypothetical protein
MNKIVLFKRSVAAVGACIALASALLAATAGSAEGATTSNQFTLCATGNYTAQAVFDDRHLSSHLVPKGQCTTVPVNGLSNDHVTVIGFFNNNPGVSFTVGSFSFNDGVGGGADAAGTTTAPQLRRW